MCGSNFYGSDVSNFRENVIGFHFWKQEIKDFSEKILFIFENKKSKPFLRRYEEVR